MALTKTAQSNLGRQFQERVVEKTYIARVSGYPEDDSGLIDLPLRCDWPNRPRQMVCYEHGKPSQTHWQVLEREKSGYTRLELKPITGRSHQLRVHLAAIGHPILGDDFYADADSFKASDRLQLHSESLTIRHPEKAGPITFHDPAPF